MNRILVLLLIVCSCSIHLSGQVILSEDFNGPILPEYLIYQNEVDLGHEYGFEGSNFFRFHPRDTSAVLEFPPLNLNGIYELSFAYSKNGFFDEDSIVVSVVSGQDNTTNRIVAVKNDTERSWEAVTMDLGEVSAENARIRFTFKGSGNYPAPYMGLENIELRQTGTLSNVRDVFNELGLTISPNPSTGLFNLISKKPIDQTLDLRVFNVTGKVNYQENAIRLGNSFSLDLSFLPNGVYQLVISDERTISSRDIIINR